MSAQVLTRLCLVRHGETAWNAERRIQGQIDIALNAAGRRQARAAGMALRAAGLTALFSSDLQRAWETAGLIGAAIGLTPQPEPALRERDYGIFAGLTYAQAEAEHPEAYAAFAGRNADYAFENGESLHGLYRRVTQRLQQLAAQHAGEAIGLVVHGGVLDVINRFVRGKPLEMARDFLIPNAGMNWLELRDGVWRIVCWGETAHLSAAALDELPA
ncbi:histidine phosphatase family protein [Azonexus sp.]|uniref:histidine phosphatase family protein n=1 Tax=Azonexus sp. TaxID=1872668 RepID=UPI0039E4A111